ncbi:class A beta-lactamase [Streptomyces sp. NPDC005017]|uniref:class A beta-lactamase n=1 Tax=Streptomyces sp. NPDC005017 TaxID=3364706 RepID=UPI00368A59E9
MRLRRVPEVVISSSVPSPSRRSLLAATGAVTATALLAAAPAAHASGPAAPDPVTARLLELEAAHGARLGVYARNVLTGRTVAHREDERFPVCSLFKTLASAAVLRDLDRDGEFLARRIHYTRDDIVENSDITEARLKTGMTVAELAEVAITHSDNTAGNLLLRELGGPTAITRFARSLGDPVTRLDRWEPELNTAEPWRRTDVTTPRAIGRTYARLVLGRALNAPDRELLTRWLLSNTTSTTRLRAGLPTTWRVADKTGGGSYGTNNDVGIAWTDRGVPLLLSVQSTRPTPDAPRVDALIKETASLLAEALA